jgi:hypothetical protein
VTAPKPAGSVSVRTASSDLRLSFAFGRLVEKGFAEITCQALDFVITLRGTGMIDVFDRNNWGHVAFLDFDLRREIHLDSAARSPFIGLPFSAALRQSQGIDLAGFDDLRLQHHYGFFVKEDYRNKGRKRMWNLDELMMAIALEYADANHLASFVVRPTGDTASYYIRKFGALRPLITGGEPVLHIPLGANRHPLQHVRSVHRAGRTHYLEVDLSADSGQINGCSDGHPT